MKTKKNYKKPHLLTKTKGDDRPQNIIFVDTESQTTDLNNGAKLHTLRLGVAQYYRMDRNRQLKQSKELVFKDNQDFIEFINKTTREKTTTYFVAHNWQFDALILEIFTRLPQNDYKLKSFYIKNMLTIITFEGNNRKFIFIDNTNFFRFKLSDLGESLGIPKLQIDFNTQDEQELITYCRRDVEIMVNAWQSWLSFLDTHELGNFRSTVSSTSLNAFRHKFMNNSIYIHAKPEVEQLERLSYRGGRTQPFFIGKIENNDFYQVDINSMYPYLMKNNVFPVSLYGHRFGGNIKNIAMRLEKYCMIARVIVTTDEPCYAIRYDNRLIFPTGTFEVTLATSELEYALKHNHIQEVLEYSWYKGENIFTDFVDYFYNLRMKYKEQGNKPYEIICKLILNSLYGKFGQWQYKQKLLEEIDHNIIGVEYDLDATTGTRYTLTAIGGGLWHSYKSGEAFHSYPAISSHVTALGRMMLYKLRKQAGDKNTYYCDTDSLIVDKIGYDRISHLIHNTELGMLKIERQSSWIDIRAGKDYALEGVEKIKGIRKNADVLSENHFRQTQFTSISGMIQHSRLDGVIVKEIEKTLKRELIGATIDPFGWVVPLVFPLETESETEIDYQPHEHV